MNRNFKFRMLLSKFTNSTIMLVMIISMVFFITRIIPGDAISMIISPDFSAELKQKLIELYKPNSSISEQYRAFILQTIKGDLGISYMYGKKVIKILSEGFKITALITVLTILFQLILTFSLLYLYEKMPVKYAEKINKIILSSYAVPSFITGIVLINIFSIKLNLFPVSGIKSHFHNDLSKVEQLIDTGKHLILPVTTLVISSFPVFFKYLYEEFIRIKSSKFIFKLKSLGVSDERLFLRHIIPNSIIPALNILGIEFGGLLGGALIIEVLFGIEGIGLLAMNAFTARDYPLIIGTTILSASVMIFSNFLADCLKILIDRRYSLSDFS